MKYRFTINERLPSLNEYIRECNRHWSKGRDLKYEKEEMIGWEIKRCLKNLRIEKPIKIHFIWVEANKKRDLDNIKASKKFIQDAMVKVGLIKNDTQKWIVSTTDEIRHEKKGKVIVEIEEV